LLKFTKNIIIKHLLNKNAKISVADSELIWDFLKLNGSSGAMISARVSDVRLYNV